MARTGRPSRLTPDIWQRILGAISAGANMRIAAELVGYTRRGLQKAIANKKKMQRELDDARELANGQIQKKVFDRAMNGDNTMLIWWTKNKMGWKDRAEVTNAGEVKHRIYRSVITADDQVETDPAKAPTDPARIEKDPIVH